MEGAQLSEDYYRPIPSWLFPVKSITPSGSRCSLTPARAQSVDVPDFGISPWWVWAKTWVRGWNLRTCVVVFVKVHRIFDQCLNLHFMTLPKIVYQISNFMTFRNFVLTPITPAHSNLLRKFSTEDPEGLIFFRHQLPPTQPMGIIYSE